MILHNSFELCRVEVPIQQPAGVGLGSLRGEASNCSKALSNTALYAMVHLSPHQVVAAKDAGAVLQHEFGHEVAA